MICILYPTLHSMKVKIDTGVQKAEFSASDSDSSFLIGNDYLNSKISISMKMDFLPYFPPSRATFER
jgi:hypothetical protein